MKSVFAGVVLCNALVFSQTRPPNPLATIHSVFVDKMPNNLDSYLRAEFVKQFKGDITVVRTKEDADATITADEKERIVMFFRSGGVYGYYNVRLAQQAAVKYVEQLIRDRAVLR